MPDDSMQDFKNHVADELASIRHRLLWFLLPSFMIGAVVLGLTVQTWTEVNDIQMRTKFLEDMRRAIKVQHADANLFILSNGFSSEERAEFYHLAEGSEVFPLDWLRALEDSKTKKLFLHGARRMGFIPDPQNAHDLPVGLTADTARGLEPLGKMVGLTCAACHVGEMTYNGKRLRIDGAPNFLDTRTFFASLVESSFATLEDPDKLVAFMARLREERADHKHMKPGIRSAAKKLFGLFVDKTEGVLAKALAPKIAELVKAEKDAKVPFALDAAVKEAGGDAQKFRAAVLKGFVPGDLGKLLEKTPLLKKAITDLEDKADEKGTLLHSLEEIYISIRLLKARAVFLKKLGAVGTNDKTIWGPGRVDAFGSARAFLFQDGYAPVNAVSYPPIWGLYRLGWFHYDNNTTSILQRNCGQALGVGAVYDPKTLSSSLRPANLYRLEVLATKLKPPTWPVDILGPIDQESAKRGAAHFTKYCVECHKTPEGTDMFKDQVYDLDKLGTDPERAKMFAEKLPDGTPFPKAIGDAMDKILKKSYEDNATTKADQDRYSKAPGGAKPVVVQWRGPGKYAARPLNGVWATGPFLHNGSVPTLDDLLKPAKDRPTAFYVGNREFDPDRLGYLSTPPEGRKNNFDTSTPGNRNTGHEYGIELKDAERKDLLEYLKLL